MISQPLADLKVLDLTEGISGPYCTKLLADYGAAVSDKAVAERIVYGALDTISSRGKSDPVDIFSQAIDNVRPMVEVKSRRVGGATYQVPVEVRAKRQLALAMRWVVDAARTRGGKSMGVRLADELLDASEKRGAAVKKREDVHRMAEANKAFSHYRW